MSTFPCQLGVYLDERTIGLLFLCSLWYVRHGDGAGGSAWSLSAVIESLVWSLDKFFEFLFILVTSRWNLNVELGPRLLREQCSPSPSPNRGIHKLCNNYVTGQVGIDTECT